MNRGTENSGKLRVLIVEDSAELRAMLAGMLEEIPGVDIVGFAETETAALDMLEEKQPDLAVIDLELKAGNGLNVLSRQAALHKKPGAVKTLVFSNYANTIIRKRCSALGAAAFFDKSFQMDELLDYIEAEAQSASSR